MYMYKMGLTLAMCYMAFRTRNMSADYSEAKFIFYSSHELLFCVVIIVPLVHLANLTPTYRYVLQSTGMLLINLVCISLTLGTRIRLALMGTTATREEAKLEARKSGESARASAIAHTSEMARTSEEASSEVDIRISGQPSSSAASEQHSEGSFNKGSPKSNDSTLVTKIDLLSAHNAILEEQIKVLTLKANAEEVD